MVCGPICFDRVPVVYNVARLTLAQRHRFARRWDIREYVGQG